LFLSGLVIIRTLPTNIKMKKMEVAEKPQIYKLDSVHFLKHDSSKEATELARRDPRFP
jgi:hypothetical protein